MHEYAEVPTDYMNGYAIDTIISKLVGSHTELVLLLVSGQLGPVVCA